VQIEKPYGVRPSFLIVKSLQSNYVKKYIEHCGLPFALLTALKFCGRFVGDFGSENIFLLLKSLDKLAEVHGNRTRAD